VHAFEVLGDPVRRRILELLAEGEQTSGAVTDRIRAEFGISQPAVSQHLKVLRDNGFATVRPEGARRLYAVDPTGLAVVDQWLDRFRAGQSAGGFWNQRLDALATELARGRRAARRRTTGGEQTVRKKETA
jgi:DNA-binding transcriptional ArsR family regulator